MAYQGLGSILKPTDELAALKGAAAKKKAEAKASNKGIAGNVVGIPAAAATAYFTGGNPTATMAAYQGGKALGEGGAELVSGDGLSADTVNQGIQASLSGISAGKEMKAAEEAAKKSKELSDLLKLLQA